METRSVHIVMLAFRCWNSSPPFLFWLFCYSYSYVSWRNIKLSILHNGVVQIVGTYQWIRGCEWKWGVQLLTYPVNCLWSIVYFY